MFDQGKKLVGFTLSRLQICCITLLLTVFFVVCVNSLFFTTIGDF